ncbi:MAG: hypothetical protein HC906_02265 [Bacteroidales bacterium]|nr:hypothetical protein [Bacteroidales bacterium]
MLKYDHSVVKKMFRVFIELAQNVSYYSAENIEIEQGMKSGVGWFSNKRLWNVFYH